MRTVTVQIAALARRVAEKLKPEKILLCGAHAVGRARGAADVDRLVVMQWPGRAVE